MRFVYKVMTLIFFPKSGSTDTNNTNNLLMYIQMFYFLTLIDLTAIVSVSVCFVLHQTNGTKWLNSIL